MATEKIFFYDDVKRNDFPDNFMFGVGTSAHQIEGAWNKDGKGLSIWDCFSLRNPGKIVGGANACVAVDNYSKMKEDVQLLKKMGVNYYRFSISWSRILPGGKVSMGKSLEGINHYNMLIDELKANDIEPFVTLFHWDLPNPLEEEYMGFLSSKIIDDFVNYADICFWEFGDRVKNWVTLNEPYRFTLSGYVEGSMAPGRGGNNDDSDPATEPYIVAFNLLNCHAAAYRKYHDDYKDYQQGKVGITLDTDYFKPSGGNSNQADLKAVQYAYDFMFGWFMEPLTRGTWPDNMQKFATSPTTKHPNGRVLPKFSDDQRNKLVNSYDFLGINYYTANFAEYLDPPVSLGYVTDRHHKPLSGQDSNGTNIGLQPFPNSWVYLCPNELTDLLSYVKKTYNVSKDIVITENGSPDQNDEGKTYEQVRDDTYRLTYIKEHLRAIKAARNNYGVNVTGYFVWSFMDSFEWASGYSARFGMIYVDYKNNNLQRYPKNSAIWFKKFLSEKKSSWWPLKRTEMDTEEVNDTLTEPQQAVEVIPKLKKAKA